MILLWPELSSRFAGHSVGQDAALNERLLFNIVALDAIVRYPFFGVGAGNFVGYFKETLPGLSLSLYQPVHNIFLLIAAESGLSAALFFVLFLGSVLGRAIRSFIKGLQGPQQFITLGFMFHALSFGIFVGMYDHFFWTIQQTALLFWLVLGLVASYSKYRITSVTKNGDL